MGNLKVVILYGLSVKSGNKYLSEQGKQVRYILFKQNIFLEI